MIFGNFMFGMLLGICLAIVAFGFLDALIGWRLPSVRMAALRGGITLGLTLCVVFTLIAWATGNDNWFDLGADNGVFLAFVTYLSAVYLTRRVARRKTHRVASVITYSTPELTPDDGAIPVRPSTAQEIADFRRRYNGGTITPPKGFAETRLYVGGK